MRRKLIIALVVLLAASMVIWMAGMARGEEELATMWVICSDSYVNIRERPSTKAKIGGRLDFGDEVQVSELVEDRSGTEWYRIEDVTELGHGYVCASYLTTSKPERVDKTATVSASGRVAVYRRVNGARKTWVKAGAQVRIRIQSDAWCLSDNGWIRSEYLILEEKTDADVEVQRP